MQPPEKRAGGEGVDAGAAVIRSASSERVTTEEGQDSRGADTGSDSRDPGSLEERSDESPEAGRRFVRPGLRHGLRYLARRIEREQV